MKEIYKQVIAHQFKFKDYLDDPAHPIAARLRTDIQRLVDEIEIQKNARTLEDRVKAIIRQLEDAEGSSVMDNHHLRDLLDRFEAVRTDLRQYS